MPYIAQFIEYISAQKRYSALTVRNYRHDIESFALWFMESGHRQSFSPREVSADDIREWILFRLDSGHIKAASMNRELSSLKSFFRFLRMRKEVDSDIFINISSLKTPKMLPSFVPQTRMASVLDDIRTQSYEPSYKSQRDSLIIALFYSCGLRLAELCSLRMSDFDSSSTSIKVLGKGDKQRIIPIVKELSERVERYKECLRNDGIPVSSDSALIVNRKGTPLSRATIQRVVQSELSKSMVQGKKSPHVLRHTFATHLLDGQADMRDIQELMGHASLRTTQHYTHNSISQLQKVYEKAHPRK